MQHRRHPPAATPQQKPVLAVIQLPFYRVKQQHLEEYLSKVYHMNRFDFGRAAGTTPGMCPEYSVRPAPPPACIDAERIRQGHGTRNVNLILNVLCLDGYIPAGHYTIDTHPEPPPATVYRDLLIQTEDPGDPTCVAFRRKHHHNRAFTRLAMDMDKMILDQKQAAPEKR